MQVTSSPVRLELLWLGRHAQQNEGGMRRQNRPYHTSNYWWGEITFLNSPLYGPALANRKLVQQHKLEPFSTKCELST